MEHGLPRVYVINGGGSGVTSDGSTASAWHKGQSGLLVGKGHGRLLFLRLRYATLGWERKWAIYVRR